MTDARFEDGGEAAISLKAETPEDLAVISALVQDAVLAVTDIRHDPRARQLALLINRFRWEDPRAGQNPERARALLVIGGVAAVRHQGIDRGQPDTVLSLLAADWQPDQDGAGRIVLTLAGDGALAADVECLDVTLRDVTRPYRAPSGQVPRHPD
ncbi:DUF2948 family protein [Paracoccus sp. p4-l81]|uniref:DUF2948 family protein n=1 Tax=unclassified Paracoccus (in: a-proteobacteria) TaxID=2688777 RepID=UPI0035B83DEB